MVTCIRTVSRSDQVNAIISERRIPVLPDDTEAHLHERIKVVERELLVQAVLDVANGALDLKELAS